jgi:hypothetical protein
MFASENISDWVSKRFADSHKIAVKVPNNSKLQPASQAPQNHRILNWELEFLPL